MKKIRYNFKGYEDKKITVQNIGRTNSPKRTATTHWIVYSSISNKTISFDIDNRAKYFDVDYTTTREHIHHSQEWGQILSSE